MNAHVETLRPYTLGYAGFAGLAGWALAGGSTGHGAVLAWLVPTIGWAAGLYGGDYFDRHLDAVAKPHRPIPSGRLRPRTALAAMVLLATLGAVAGAVVNWRTPFLAVAVLGAGIGYSTVFKARGAAGNAVRGAMTAGAFLFGAMTVVPWPPARLLPYAVALLLHDAATNVVGTLRDVAGDRANGYRTVAVRRSPRTAVALAAACWCTALAIVAVEHSRGALLAVAVVTGGLGLAHAARSTLGAGDPDAVRALRAHDAFVAERLVLAAALVAAGGRTGLALGVLVPSLAVTLATRRMRAGYEFGGVPAAAEIVAHVDRELARLAAGAVPSALRGWTRTVRIEVTQPDLALGLRAEGGRLLRTDAPERADVTIRTDGATYRDVFLLGVTNPRRAYLARRVRIDGAPADFVRLNQLFNEFRRRVPAPVAVRERAPEPAALAPRVVVSDTTLRDGEQMPGVAFGADVKVDLARRLDRLGVPLIEAGFPAVSADEVAAIRRIVDAGLDAVVQVIARPLAADVDAAIESGAASIAVFVGTSDAHVATKLGLSRDELHARIGAAVARAKAAGRNVVFAAEDATRTRPEDLVAALAVAVGAGADAVGIADTAGVATPESMAALVGHVVAAVPVPVAVHCHDDLGLATANSLAALRAGASGVQCSVAGIGERAGNAPLEQVVLALEVLYDRRTGIDLTGLTSLARHVATLTGHPLPVTAPVVGGHAFTHESGLHVDGVIRDPATYEPYPPALVGRERSFVYGKHSGAGALRAALGAGRDVAPVLAALKNGSSRAVDAAGLADLAESVTRR